MAPKKKEQQKMSLGDFLTDSGFGGGSWADEVEETFVAGTQPLPVGDRPRLGGSMSSWQERGYSIRESVPQQIPDKPPFTAHLGNLSYDATTDTLNEFFEGCQVASVRIIEDREMQRPKGFGYVEFADVEGLKKALTLDGQSYQGRIIRIKVADPPRDGRGESTRDLSDWTRKGPLPDIPSRGGRQPSDFGERRLRDPALAEGRSARELTWERRGPLSPLPQQEMGPRSRDDSRPRPSHDAFGEGSDSSRGNHRQAPATWGEGRRDGSRPPRREQPERVERVASAAEKDMQWRERMRPDGAVKSTTPSRDGSEAPPSPAMSSAAAPPAVRPRLNLQKRTVSEAVDTSAAAAATTVADPKASPFGAARPIDTATRERQIEEKRQQAAREKREAEEKLKEEKRLARQAAVAKAEAEAQARAAQAKEAGTKEGDEQAAEAKTEGVADKSETGVDAAADKTEEKATDKPTEKTKEKADETAGEKDGVEKTTKAKPNGEAAASEAKPSSARSREGRDPRENRDHPAGGHKSRAAEAGNWRSTNEQRPPRGPPGGRGGRGGGRGGGARNDGRGPRTNGSAAQQVPAATGGEAEAAAGTPDEDGWTKVPNKKGRQGRPPVSS